MKRNERKKKIKTCSPTLLVCFKEKKTKGKEKKKKKRRRRKTEADGFFSRISVSRRGCNRKSGFRGFEAESSLALLWLVRRLPSLPLSLFRCRFGVRILRGGTVQWACNEGGWVGGWVGVRFSTRKLGCSSYHFVSPPQKKSFNCFVPFCTWYLFCFFTCGCICNIFSPVNTTPRLSSRKTILYRPGRSRHALKQ